ncbi:hypothetical protein [uncultured Aeromicrobium sp.]|uniref:hypothetical protein n=1 Tax=uncultured Aeromicrobium sp. TaxID=337820 RepID=UPI0025F29F1D|nr:hypothetical protein [uncultured Aeromicrobium sp.]
MKTMKTSLRRPSIAGGIVGAAAALLVASTSVASAEPTVPPLNVNWDVEGTSHIGGGVDSTTHIGPTTLYSQFDPMTLEIVGGTMEIPDSVMEFDIVGIPAQATVSLTQVTPMTGEIEEIGLGQGALRSEVSYDIQISDLKAKIFGIWWPLGVGSRCHTIDPVNISVNTPEGASFSLATGGPVEGTYSIGQFTGCAPLNFFDIPGFFPWFGSIPVNAIVPNDDNSIQLNITNPRFGG